MINQINNFLKRDYPQNLIIRKPLLGGCVLTLFIFGFLILYQPINVSKSALFGFEVTMGLYCLSAGFLVWLFVKIIKRIDYFSNCQEWSFLKEVASVVFILMGSGIGIYFAGFLIEWPSSSRWNIATFFDSFIRTFLVGVLPFTFFSVLNYRFLLFPSQGIEGDSQTKPPEEEPSEELIKISSKLKKEELSFFPSQFVYAASNGNYVDFYLAENNQTKKETIRNSIGNIEKQLSGVPFILKTHRAFIVNLNRVQTKQGNTLGYQLTILGTDMKIPVSRQNTHCFNQRLEQCQE